tara:strand:+ start:392 stop:589 length:198 start_codon:yes stop_codon:yes gene_type:complete
MDAIQLAEYMLKDIRQQKADYTQRLADGSVGDWNDYRFVVGQIRGLTYSEDLIKSVMKGIELEDG